MPPVTLIVRHRAQPKTSSAIVHVDTNCFRIEEPIARTQGANYRCFDG